MTTFIASISDTKVRELLKKMKKEDMLILYYKSNEKQVPIDMITLFSETKGRVEFKEYSDDVTVAFETGRLYGEADKKNNAALEIVGDNQVFGKLKALLTGTKKQKRPSERKTPPQKTEQMPQQLSFDMVAAAGDTVKSSDKGRAGDAVRPSDKGKPADTAGASDKVKAAAEGKPAGQKKKADTEDTEKLFDEAYSKFDSLLVSLKTKIFNPVTARQGIFSALRLMQEEDQTFEEALKKSLSDSVQKKFFSEISPENIEKIREAGLEVIRYDNP
jgi:hypothetical protein